MSRRFSTTLPYFSEPTFARGAHFLPPAHEPERIGELKFELTAFRSIIAEAAQCSILVLDSISKSSLMACCVIALWPRHRRPRIIMHGEMWNPDNGFRFLMQRAIVRQADRAIERYIVLSSEELAEFPRIWGVRAEKMSFVPFFWTLKSKDREAIVSDGDYIFAGGNSHRDYAPLVEAARKFPEKKFILATENLKNLADLPPNVTAGPVPHDEFVGLLKGAAVVVVPIARGLNRSAGQQTYLNAMLLGKPVVVSQAFAVADHIEDGVSGLVVDGTAQDYARALQWLWSRENEAQVAQMRQTAAEVADTRFSYEKHVIAVSKIIDEMLQDTASLTHRANVLLNSGSA